MNEFCFGMTVYPCWSVVNDWNAGYIIGGMIM